MISKDLEKLQYRRCLAISMPLNRWSTLASFHRTMILRVCRLSLPVAAGGASIDAGVGVCGLCGLCGRAAPRAHAF